MIGIAVFVVCCFAAINCLASGHGHNDPKKVGILLVAFGSSEASAQVSFENIDKMTQKTYPNIPVRWAYTSYIIREKLAKQGKHLDSPEVALAKMMDEKFTHVAVQSLHTIGGAEYHDLRRTVGAFKMMGGFQKVILGYPLMSTQEDMQKVSAAIMGAIPAERKTDEAVVLMGHGTPPPVQCFLCSPDVSTAAQRPEYHGANSRGIPWDRSGAGAAAQERYQKSLSDAINVRGR